jgi:hypothetical protein
MTVKAEKREQNGRTKEVGGDKWSIKIFVL